MLHRILRISLSLLNLRKAQAAALCQCLLLFCRQRIPGKRTGHTVIAELFKNLYVCLVPNGIFHRKRRKGKIHLRILRIQFAAAVVQDTQSEMFFR